MRRMISFILAFIMLCGLSGCGGNTEKPVATGGSAAITDALGREVSVPETVERIVVLGNAPRMAVYLGLDGLVAGYSGMSGGDISPLTAYAYVTKDAWADKSVVGTDSSGNTSYNSEEIILTGADVIFCTATADVADRLQRETGIPCVALEQGTLFGEDFERSLGIMAAVCGVGERAEAIFDYVDECLGELAGLTAGIPEAGRRTVLSAAATFRGAHGIEGIRVNDPVMQSINALNLADADAASGVKDSYTVDKEQILAWNPEYIFLDSGGVSLVRRDYAEHPEFYAALDAFEDGHIYQYPSSTSYYDNMEISLANCYFVGSVLYPEAFAGVDFEAKAGEIFDFFLGEPDYAEVLAEFGAYYGTVDLENE